MTSDSLSRTSSEGVRRPEGSKNELEDVMLLATSGAEKWVFQNCSKSSWRLFLEPKSRDPKESQRAFKSLNKMSTTHISACHVAYTWPPTVTSLTHVTSNSFFGEVQLLSVSGCLSLSLSETQQITNDCPTCLRLISTPGPWGLFALGKRVFTKMSICPKNIPWSRDRVPGIAFLTLEFHLRLEYLKQFN